MRAAESAPMRSRAGSQSRVRGDGEGGRTGCTSRNVLNAYEARCTVERRDLNQRAALAGRIDNAGTSGRAHKSRKEI